MNLFPTYLALGEAFCNRTQELKRLTANIIGTNPTLIMSPRRYGKTSMALKAFEQLDYPYAHMDFYKALTEEEIERVILNGIGQLLGQLETTPKRLLALASEFFAGMQIRVVIEKMGEFSLDFSRRQQKPAETILKALEKLHELASKKKQVVILFFDEFQVLGEVISDHSLEAAIREAAQKSTSIAYVFSGSHRHLMHEMFYDKKRPFYKLCDVILLDRIEAKAYQTHIQQAAKTRWQKELTMEVLNTLFRLTERHSYYINKLCSLLWLSDYPDTETVEKLWYQYVLENKSLIEREMELLTLNQRKILILLAREGVIDEPYGKVFANKLNLPLSSIARAMKTLHDRDYIYDDGKGKITILDPLIKHALSVGTTQPMEI